MKSTALAFALFLMSLPAWAVELQPGRIRILGEMLQSVPDDVSRIFTYPVKHPDQTQLFALGVGALILLDRPVTEYYQNHVEKPLSGFSLPSSPLTRVKVGGFNNEDSWLVFGIGSTYLGGLAFDDPKAQAAGLLATKAMGYSILVSHLLLKPMTGRKRPLASLSHDQPDGVFTDDPYDFGHFRKPTLGSQADSTSMPSYHFTMFFAVAKVYQRAYDNYWLPYTAAALGLASNIKGHRHWVSDMVAGALIGTAIGNAVSEPWFDDDGKMKIEPFLDAGGGVGLQVSKRF